MKRVFERVLRVLAVAVLAYLVFRAVAPPPPTRPPPSSDAALPYPTEVGDATWDELVTRGSDLLCFMRRGIVSEFKPEGIFVPAGRWRRLGEETRDEVCATLRIRSDEVRPVFDESGGVRLGHCDASARFVPAGV